MHLIRQYKFGPAENLRYEEVEDLRPGPGQVRIAVRAAGVHLIDTVIRQGVSHGPPLPELPMTPGREVAGVVDEVGEGVEGRWLGARVAAHLGMASGGYAGQAVRDVAAVHALPDGASFEAAVAMIGTGRTTVGLLDFARLTPDDVVLVTGAAGGIGNLLVQTGRDLGATVVAVAGGEAKLARARAAGATITVDAHDPGWPARVRDALGAREVTVALDGVGGTLGRAALELLGGGGRLVLFGTASGHPTEFSQRDVIARGLSVTWTLGAAMRRWRPTRDLETQALAELAAGRWVPDVHPFALKDAPAAHTALETRAAIGKVVLVP